jgi:hypothetical protein
MIILPQTKITDASFNKWKAHRIDVDDTDDPYHYYVIPLMDIDENEVQELEFIPTLFSSESTEFMDDDGNPIYTLRLFDEDLPELEFEEEVEILYNLLTKKEIYLK